MSGEPRRGSVRLGLVAGALAWLLAGAGAPRALAGGAPAEPARGVLPAGERWVGSDGRWRLLYRPRFVPAAPLLADLGTLGTTSVEWGLDGGRGQLLLTGPEQGFPEARAALAWLDVPRPQALVEVTIVETIRDCAKESGSTGLFDRDLPAGAPDTFFRGLRWDFEPDRYLRRALVGERPYDGTSLVFGRSSEDGAFAGTFASVIRGLAETGEAQILASPVLVCTEGMKSSVSSTLDLPSTIFSAEFGVQRRSVVSERTGVRLEVELEHVGTDAVRLRVLPWVRQVAEGSADQGPSGVPVLVERRLESRNAKGEAIGTLLTVPDGTAVVLGGVGGARRVRDRRGYPWLDRLPAVDVLASARTTENLTSDVLVLVRARILQPGRDGAPTLPPSEWDRLRRRASSPGLRALLTPPDAAPAVCR